MRVAVVGVVNNYCSACVVISIASTSMIVAINSRCCNFSFRVVHMLSAFASFWLASDNWVVSVVMVVCMEVMVVLSANVAFDRLAIAVAVSCCSS